MKVPRSTRLRESPKVRYRFIQGNPEYSVAKWAGILQIERTGYYAWLRNREAIERREAHLKKRVKEEFEESRGAYGPDRITAELRKKGERIGRKKCAEYMADMNLDSCHNRHRAKSLTNSRKARGDGYRNIISNQEFPIAPRMGLTRDITYLRTDEGFMYHCVIRDIVTGEVLGDHMADRMTKELVINAILAMLGRHELPEGCIFHSDRGSQYTSKAVMGLLQQYGDEVEVFLPPKGTLVNIKAGVWHCAGFPYRCDKVHILCALPERTYATDCTVIDIPKEHQIQIIDDLK